MSTLRRFLVVIALMYWLGGFTFYASVVVPLSTAVLKSTQRQGFITREVTFYLNLAAVAALILLGCDLFSCRDPSRLRVWARLVLWLLMAVCQAVLFSLHAYLSGMMISKGRIIHDLEAFRPGHRLYLWTHTVQWGAGLIFIFLMIRAWQSETAIEAAKSASKA